MSIEKMIVKKESEPDFIKTRELLEQLEAKFDSEDDKTKIQWIEKRIPFYLKNLPLNKESTDVLIGYVSELHIPEETLKSPVGSSSITIEGIVNWLDARCVEYCQVQRNTYGEAPFLIKARKDFQDRGGFPSALDFER